MLLYGVLTCQAMAAENSNQDGQDSSEFTTQDYTKFATVGGGLIAGISLLLPWAVAIQDVHSWNGLETEFSFLVIIGAIIAVALPFAAWDGNGGRLAAIVTGLVGAGLAALSLFLRDMINETVAFGHMELDGHEIPIAAIESGSGVDVLFLGGAIVVVGSLGAIISSLN